MKLSAISLCIACTSLFGQDRAKLEQRARDSGQAAHAAQDLCSIVQNATAWSSKAVSVDVMLLSNSHGPELAPAKIQSDPQRKCRAFPILPGELPQFSKNISPYSGPGSQAITDAIPPLPFRQYLRDFCTAATGIVHVVDHFQYDKRNVRGNGFGDRGRYSVGLVITSLKPHKCQ